MNYVKSALLSIILVFPNIQIKSAIIEFGVSESNKKFIIEAINKNGGHYFSIRPSDGHWFSYDSKKGIEFSVRYYDNFGKLIQYKARVPLFLEATNNGNLYFEGINPLYLDPNRKSGITEELKYVSYFFWDTVSSVFVKRESIKKELNINLFHFCFLNNQLLKIKSNTSCAIRGYSLYCGVQKEHKIIWTRFSDDTLIISLNYNSNVSKLIFRYFSNYSVGDYLKDSFVHHISPLPVSINSCRDVLIDNSSNNVYEIGLDKKIFNELGINLNDFLASNPINLRVYDDGSIVYFPNFQLDSNKPMLYSIKKSELESLLTIKFYIGQYLFWSQTFETSHP